MYSSSDGGETLEPHNDGAGDNNCVTTIARDGGKLFAGWNYYNTDWWFQLEWMPRSWCHLLWSETPSNLHNSNDRGKSAKAPAALGLAKPRRF